jgi:hypothetical protein
VPELARRLAVAREALGRLVVERGVGPALERLAGQPTGAQSRLDQPNVPIFAGVAAGHDGEGWDRVGEAEAVKRAGRDERCELERLGR